MENNSLDDSEFVTRLLTCTFPPNLFTHKAHLRLAWAYLQNNPVPDAVNHVCKNLFRYVIHLGAADKYHTTLTVASVNLIAHFQRKKTANTFEEFVAKYPQLLTSFKQILETYYSKGLLNSEAAKKFIYSTRSFTLHYLK
jgi:hypothetical protein